HHGPSVYLAAGSRGRSPGGSVRSARDRGVPGQPRRQGFRHWGAYTAAAARALGLQHIVLRATSERETDTAFATMAQQSGDALDVNVDPFFLARRDQIVALAACHAIPAIYPVRDFALAGGLMSYGTDFADSYRQAGIYAGRVVRGERPADLPVQRSTKFEFVINFKTAKALGLAVPNSMQLLADEVIE